MDLLSLVLMNMNQASGDHSWLMKRRTKNNEILATKVHKIVPFILLMKIYIPVDIVYENE